MAFPRAGYYRIEAVALNRRDAGSTPRIVAGMEILEKSHESLWVLVDGDGGRLTKGYDRDVIDSAFVPLFGAYGPFLRRKDRESLREQIPTNRSMQRSAASESPGVSVSGVVTYGNRDVTPLQQQAVTGAEVEALCLGKSEPWMEEYDLVQQVLTATGPSGSFSISCAAPYEYVQGTIRLRNQHVYAAGPSNAYAGADFSGFDGSYFTLTVANDYAARVFLDLSQWIPEVFSKFARPRSRIYVEVSPIDDGFGIYYCSSAGPQCPVADMIRTNYTRVFSGGSVPNDGLFVILHEYAHAFHYVAIEPWASYSCNDSNNDGQPEHFWTETETLSCAFVEGFADFLAMWTANTKYASTPYGGDYGLEENVDGYPLGSATNPPQGGDGLRVEAAVAAFLYDLADGNGELDDPTNQQGASESFDNVSVPASWIASVIQHCRLSYFIGALNGPDEMVYCLEGSPGAYAVGQTFSSAWRSYSSVQFDQPIESYDANAIRTLWRKNFYGVLP